MKKSNGDDEIKKLTFVLNVEFSLLQETKKLVTNRKKKKSMGLAKEIHSFTDPIYNFLFLKKIHK